MVCCVLEIRNNNNKQTHRLHRPFAASTFASLPAPLKSFNRLWTGKTGRLRPDARCLLPPPAPAPECISRAPVRAVYVGSGGGDGEESGGRLDGEEGERRRDGEGRGRDGVEAILQTCDTLIINQLGLNA